MTETNIQARSSIDKLVVDTAAASFPRRQSSNSKTTTYDRYAITLVLSSAYGWAQ